MDSLDKMPTHTSLFQVFLRLRPPQNTKQQNEQWLVVEPPATPAEEQESEMGSSHSTHITLQPPNDSRKRAIERFGFTKIFTEKASQSDVFQETGTAESIKSLVQDSRDGLVATLGVTGSGKSHTILGTKSQRGLTQMTLDVLYNSLGSQTRESQDTNLISSLQSADPSEAQLLSANNFLDTVYGEGDRVRSSRAQTPMTGTGSRAQTPMVRPSILDLPGSFPTHTEGNAGTDNRKDIASKNHEVIACPKSMEPHSLSFRDHQSPVFPSGPFWKRLYPKRMPANAHCVKEFMHNHHNRRQPVPRPDGFAQEPDVSNHAFEVDEDVDYAVIVSMYEVYNDRIFDLLASSVTAPGVVMSTRQGTALQKGLTRRPLLFKNTELSPDRKVVAGLRKIVCGTYEEAMMVLETGLTERRVAGTGSNSVSSRSHGFFCIEVKKTPKRFYSSTRDWTGATLSIVDLAGSERARNAKTTGSTLAEAGKINESLMYLGQCLQVQSDCQQDGSKPIVPFRQCKLTELLFSNSFPSVNQQTTTYKQPQRAVMVVTADPHGDFNATSQILRYSALAREVTVPRIPSVTSAIVGGINKGSATTPSGRLTPGDHYFSTQELEQATNEVQRLAEECESLSVRLTEEEIKRTEAELRLQAMEERLIANEQDVREECWQEMELMLEEEKDRWRTAWEEERQRGEAYLDGKIDILERTSQFRVHDASDDNGRLEEVERENEALRAKIQALEQEMLTKSPTKQKRGGHLAPGEKNPALGESSSTNIVMNPFLSALSARESGSALKVRKTAEDKIDPSDISPRKLSLRSSTSTQQVDSDVQSEMPATTMKKQRKLTTKKWDLDDTLEI